MENIYNTYAMPGVEMDTWINRYKEIREENSDDSFITEAQIASMVNESFSDNENEVHQIEWKIKDLIPGMDEANFKAVITHISPVRSFTSKKGKKLDLQRVTFSDPEENFITLDIWNRNINSWKKIREDEQLEEGDLVELVNINIGEYKGDLTASWTAKTQLKLIGKHFSEIQDPISNLKDISKEGEYHLQGIVLFIGEVQLVGVNKTPLQKIIFTDDWNEQVEICVWRETLPYKQGDKIDIHITTSTYNNTLNYNYDNNYETKLLSSHTLDMNTSLMEEIEQLDENETVNIVGKIIRIYNDVPYDKGYITTWLIELDDDTQIEFTMFGETGRNYSAVIGQKLMVYNAVVNMDTYNYCKKLIHSYGTLITLLDDVDESLADNFVNINEIQPYADKEGYIDVAIRVIQKNNPITYMRMDNSSSTVTHYKICDDTNLVKMVVWGDQHVFLQYGGEYKLYNVKVKENYETEEFEIHVDSRTRIEEAELNINIEQLYTTVPTLSDDLDNDLIAVQGVIEDLEIYEYPRCPQCNGRLTETMRGYYCDSCKTEPFPKMLWKLDLTVNGNLLILWDEVAHSLLDPYVTKEVDILDQKDILKKKLYKPYKYCGTVDYDEKQDQFMLKVSAIVPADITPDMEEA
jgi:replication factor A1